MCEFIVKLFALFLSNLVWYETGEKKMKWQSAVTVSKNIVWSSICKGLFFFKTPLKKNCSNSSPKRIFTLHETFTSHKKNSTEWSENKF